MPGLIPGGFLELALPGPLLLISVKLVADSTSFQQIKTDLILL